MKWTCPLKKRAAAESGQQMTTRYFRNIFNSGPDSTNLAAALAAFERTLETSDSPFDNWKFSDDPRAVSDAVKRRLYTVQ